MKTSRSSVGGWCSRGGGVDAEDGRAAAAAGGGRGVLTGGDGVPVREGEE